MSFSIEKFARTLLAEALFFDDETYSYGTVTLVDETQQKERYLASFDPEAEVFVIEEAVEWEHIDADGDGKPDYWLAGNGTEYGSYPTAAEAAEVLLALARESNLAPSVTLHIETEAEDEGDA